MRLLLRDSLKRVSPFQAVSTASDGRDAISQLPIIVFVQAVRFLIFLATTWTLTASISAAEFGKLMMVGVPVSLAALLGDLGFGDGVVRAPDVTPRLCSLLLYINASVAAAASLLVLATVPAFEWWFGVQGLWWITVAFVGAAFLSSIASQYRALLRRQLRLVSLEINDLAVTLSSAGASIALALKGHGAIAIPIGRVVGIMVEILGLVWLTGWRPGQASRIHEARPIGRFGLKLMLSGVVHFGGAAVTVLILGRVYSPEMLGLLERATAWTKGIIERIAPLVRRVYYSLLGRRYQVSAERANSLGTRLVRVSVLLWVPMVLPVAAISGDSVGVLLGNDWGDLRPLLPWLVASFLLWLPLQAASSLLLAHGHSGVLLVANGGLVLVRLTLAMFAALIGLKAYVAAGAVVDIAFSAVLIAAVAKRTGVAVWNWYGRIAVCVVVGAAVGFGLYCIRVACGMVCALCVWAIWSGIYSFAVYFCLVREAARLRNGQSESAARSGEVA